MSITTLDDLISEYGEPTLVKIDTEGFDHLVLRGLSRPIEHIVFEVHAARRMTPQKPCGSLSTCAATSTASALTKRDDTTSQKRPEEILAELPD